MFDIFYWQKDDPDWAKRRKSEWLAWPGTIQFTRERTLHVKQEGEEEKEEKEKSCQEKMREIKIKVVKKPPAETKIENPRVVVGDIWPRRKRTDITELYH